MCPTELKTLSRRERQIMDIVFERGAVTAGEVREALDDPPSYSAVRASLRILERKGHIRHEQDGPRYVFVPTAPKEEVRRTELTHLVRTFFGGSPEHVVAALLDEEELDPESLERLEKQIADARKAGR
jgi:predicted transcriptional regulator